MRMSYWGLSPRRFSNNCGSVQALRLRVSTWTYQSDLIGCRSGDFLATSAKLIHCNIMKTYHHWTRKSTPPHRRLGSQCGGTMELTMPTETRDQAGIAMSLGRNRYFTGEFSRRGHVAERWRLSRGSPSQEHPHHKSIIWRHQIFRAVALRHRQ